MSKKNIFVSALTALLVAVIVLAAIPSGSVSAAGIDRRGGPQDPAGVGIGTGAGTGFGAGAGFGQAQGAGMFGTGLALFPLTAQEEDALEKAILEEYGAYNLYQYIADTYDYGDLFGQIAQAEMQHTNALIRLAEKYGMVVPKNPGLTNPPVFTSMEEACQMGVDAEIHDAELYDELMLLTGKADLEQVYTRLQTASLESHLPAFEACLAECQLAQ